VGNLGTTILEASVGVIVVTIWYVAFVRYNRKKAAEVLGWIKTAFSGHAQILGVHWASPSRFHVRMRLVPNVFQHSHLVVQLIPREFALNWLISCFKKQQEVATFEADLDVPPGFNLEVHNQRWCGRSRGSTHIDPDHSTIENVGPFVITTRRDWQREITSMMNALVASRDSDFLSVSFRRTSPHFSATVPLSCISPQNATGNNVFRVLRELADCAGASRF
jgi:hypothetical protein